MRTYFLLFFSCLLSTTLAFAQKPVKAKQKADTYPAARVLEGDKMSAFAGKFQHTNVGNMHVYAKPAAASDHDYYFNGEEISDTYFSLFDSDWNKYMGNETMTSSAVYQIKGDAQTYFLVRMQSPTRGERIELFEVSPDRKQMMHKQTLAFADCNNGLCYQQDSWVQDLDGDTRLDIIKKMRVIDQFTGRLIEDYTVILQQRPDGTFDRNSSLRADLSTYDMHDLGGSYSVKNKKR